MSGFPKNEWEYLLQAKITLSDHITFRFDATGNRCLYDLRQAQSWRLDPWQSRFLDQLHRGASFPEAVRHVVTDFPGVANRESISDLVRSLRLLGALKVGRQTNGIKSTPGSALPDRGLSRSFELPFAWIQRMATGLGVVTIVGWGIGTTLSWGELAESRENRLVDRYPVIQEEAPREVALSEILGVRAWTSGVIESVLVEVGDEVSQGQVIARVADPVRETIRNDLRLALGEARAMRDQAYQSGDMAAYLAESRSIAKLTRDLSRWDSEDSGTDLVAPADGKVQSLEFSSLMVGFRVQPGDIVATIESTLVPSGDSKKLVAVSRR